MNGDFTMNSDFPVIPGYPGCCSTNREPETRMNTGIPGNPGFPGYQNITGGAGLGAEGNQPARKFLKPLCHKEEVRVLPGLIYCGSFAPRHSARVWRFSIVNSNCDDLTIGPDNDPASGKTAFLPFESSDLVLAKLPTTWARLTMVTVIEAQAERKRLCVKIR